MTQNLVVSSMYFTGEFTLCLTIILHMYVYMHELDTVAFKEELLVMGNCNIDLGHNAGEASNRFSR